MRSSNFVPVNIIFPREFLLYLSNEHKEIIKNKLGILILQEAINLMKLQLITFDDIW